MIDGQRLLGQALMLRLVRERLATATPERTFAAGKPVEVTHVRTTDAGAGAGGDGSHRRRARPLGKKEPRVSGAKSREEMSQEETAVE